ncbi:hypothetical protein PV328_007330 [Microctonus aethiopoides]|uniref:Receptor ligand binding region domain-containing protein n=1 Tax=Microctonus aethiopoides TaxID=144406 RepID=A0AA39KUL5_9HYME|nr:hypothetical protein PV328_007330 [Microctonus aethiopoides]
MPVLDLAVYHARAEKIFPSWLQLTFLPQDDHCDATYAQIAAIDSYAECVHLFLGPACDYSVASVGRAVKFLNAPLITTGAFTFDFTEKKTACPDEYFMTTRVGSLAFRGISDVFLSPNGQRNFAGRHTCQLMMKSMVQSIKARQDITFGNFDVESMGLYDYRESLKTNIGNYYGGNALTVPVTREPSRHGLVTNSIASPKIIDHRIVKIGVIAPADPHHEQSLLKILPAVALAVNAVSLAKGPLPGWTIIVDYRDSKCSSTHGSLAAFDFHINKTAGHFYSLI